MKACAQDIESIATGNTEFRRIPCTATHCQQVVLTRTRMPHGRGSASGNAPAGTGSASAPDSPG